MQAGMASKIDKWIERYRCMDWAVLYMRMLAGGALLLHNIGKIQNYNKVVSSYPTPPGIGSAAMLVIASLVEVLLAVCIVMGLRVRTAALLLALGAVLRMVQYGFAELGPSLPWLGIFVFLVISGGGLYAFDGVISASKREK